jgi:hypothetical protein
MHREEIQNLLSNFGFAETLNKPLTGINVTHMMHRSDKLKKLVEYKIDPLGMVDIIWGFDSSDLVMFENTVDFEIWLNKL